jgi:hypothetical protein
MGGNRYRSVFFDGDDGSPLVGVCPTSGRQRICRASLPARRVALDAGFQRFTKIYQSLSMPLSRKKTGVLESLYSLIFSIKIFNRSRKTTLSAVSKSFTAAISGTLGLRKKFFRPPNSPYLLTVTARQSRTLGPIKKFFRIASAKRRHSHPDFL